MGTEYELFHLAVWMTAFTTLMGLLAFASGLERYFIRKATWIETVLFLFAAAALFWPAIWADVIGVVLLAGAIGLQIWYKPNLDLS